MENTAAKTSDERVEKLLASASSLPALPSAAAHILRISDDEYATTNDLIKAIQVDPGLSAKILKVANSPLYGRSGQIETLRQASSLLGFGGTLNLALSLSVSSSLRSCKTDGLDVVLFWRRSLLAGGSARLLGQQLMPPQTEALFFASLMQDLGMLVIDNAEPDFYKGGVEQSNHDSLEQHEQAILGLSHPSVGAALAKVWGFSERMQAALRYSHTAKDIDFEDEETAQFVAIVAASARIADYLLHPDDGDILILLSSAEGNLGIGADQIYDVFQRMTQIVPKLESLFNTRLLSEQKLAQIAQAAQAKLEQLSGA